jgi:methoxymalonate biosynthesis acyl carrier protein
MSTDPRPALRTFLARFFQNRPLGDDENIFSLGYVNSMFALELVAFVEREFSFKVASEDLEIANFRSVDALAALVARKVRGDVA